jgi:hypothetical protein
MVRTEEKSPGQENIKNEAQTAPQDTAGRTETASRKQLRDAY